MKDVDLEQEGLGVPIAELCDGGPLPNAERRVGDPEEVLRLVLLYQRQAGPPQARRAAARPLLRVGFDGPLTQQGPTGWFKAMSPAQTDGLRAGIEQVPQRGSVAFIEQTEVKVKVANNWAQRVQTIPVGARVRVAADVKTQNMPANTGFVMVQCWDEAERPLGGASSQSVEPIGGTEDWRRVSFEVVVPLGTDVRMRRGVFACGGGRFQIVLQLDLSKSQ
jgi:hypothetical protein